jgi:hypothetical protein
MSHVPYGMHHVKNFKKINNLGMVLATLIIIEWFSSHLEGVVRLLVNSQRQFHTSSFDHLEVWPWNWLGHLPFSPKTKTFKGVWGVWSPQFS